MYRVLLVSFPYILSHTFQTGLHGLEETCEVLHEEQRLVLKFGHFGRYIRNTWKVLKCDVGEGRRRSVGPIM